jgi:hypothetical protein
MGAADDAAAVRPLLARFRHLPIVGLASTLATLLNPSGIGALLYPISTYGGTGNPSMRYISEWQSPNFHQPFYLLFAVALVALGLVRPTSLAIAPNTPAPYRDGEQPATSAAWPLTLCLAAFSFMALQSARHLPLFALVFAAVMGPRLDALVARILARERRPEPPRFARLNLAATTALLALLALGLVTRPGAQLGREPLLDHYPTGGVEHILSTGPAGNVFNTYHWGGFLVFRMYPARLPFVDGRADVHGQEIMDDYVKVVGLHPAWRDILQRYDIRVALLEKDSPLAVVLADDPAWERTYRGRVEEVFVRRAGSLGEEGSR